MVSFAQIKEVAPALAEELEGIFREFCATDEAAGRWIDAMNANPDIDSLFRELQAAGDKPGEFKPGSNILPKFVPTMMKAISMVHKRGSTTASAVAAVKPAPVTVTWAMIQAKDLADSVVQILNSVENEEIRKTIDAHLAEHGMNVEFFNMLREKSAEKLIPEGLIKNLRVIEFQVRGDEVKKVRSTRARSERANREPKVVREKASRPKKEKVIKEPRVRLGKLATDTGKMEFPVNPYFPWSGPCDGWRMHRIMLDGVYGDEVVAKAVAAGISPNDEAWIKDIFETRPGGRTHRRHFNVTHEKVGDRDFARISAKTEKAEECVKMVAPLIGAAQPVANGVDHGQQLTVADSTVTGVAIESENQPTA